MLGPHSIERIRASINAGLAVQTLERLMAKGGPGDAVKATAALGLLRKVLPDLQATDLTSKGESITVERLSFKHTPRETAHVQEAAPGEAVAQVNDTEVAGGD